MTDTRVPAGVPTGGQFAASAKAEAGVTLASPTEPRSTAVLAKVRETEQRLHDLQNQVGEQTVYAAALLVTERFPDARRLVLAPAEDASTNTYPAFALDENGGEMHDFESDYSHPDTRSLQVLVMNLRPADYDRPDAEPYPDIDDARAVDLRAVLASPPAGVEPTPDYGHARRLVSRALSDVFEAEIANERHGGVSPATVDSTIDSIHQGLPMDDYGIDGDEAMRSLLAIRAAVPGDTPVADLIY